VSPGTPLKRKTTSNNKEMIALPVPVQGMIEWWLPQVREILDEQLLSVVLYGSVTLGDFQPGWSDIDVCVVLVESVTEDTGERLGRVYDLMRRRYLEERRGGWMSGQVLESHYIPAALASATRGDLECYIAGGKTGKLQRGDPFQPFDRYMLAKHGQTFFGQTVRFMQPTAAQLREQAEIDVSSLMSWKSQSAVWLAAMLHWMARSLVFWRDGRLLSKTAALQHEISRDCMWEQAFDLALSIRREGSDSAAMHKKELQEYYAHFSERLSSELRRFIAMSSHSNSMKPES